MSSAREQGVISVSSSYSTVFSPELILVKNAMNEWAADSMLGEVTTKSRWITLFSLNLIFSLIDHNAMFEELTIVGA